ncbi:hypothetical protein Desaci_3380 [Desulfosporosinus acidiphilus SJ4]|uniref:Uncharacterized protein n=1 Tax=Desulfosporosinus acidiphilus (strain DSM 22704 / JCM 16185 / SJ4) TaxID=646529 RepID=I4D900_DESAJ|nr:hypothetical protein Desaci_3380 [Desulfosporosinus acidiphilus SJ4]
MLLLDKIENKKPHQYHVVINYAGKPHSFRILDERTYPELHRIQAILSHWDVTDRP